MTTEKELQAQKAERELHKNTQKVLAALQLNPFGLSGNQLTTICRLSIKTVRNVISTRTDITENLGVYTLNQPKPVAEVQAAAPVVKQPVAIKQETQKVNIPSVQFREDDKAVAAATVTKESNLVPDQALKPKRNVQAELLQLLQENKDGLLSEVITSTLNITDKQLSQAMWLLRKTWNINRTGLPGESHYQLVVNEAVEEAPPEEQPVAAKPETQKVCIPSLEFREGTKATDAATTNNCENWPIKMVQKQPEVLTHVLGIEINPGVKADSTDTPATLLDEYKSQIQTIVTRKSKLKLEVNQLQELLTDLFGLSQFDWFIEGGHLVVLMSDEVVA